MSLNHFSGGVKKPTIQYIAISIRAVSSTAETVNYERAKDYLYSETKFVASKFAIVSYVTSRLFERNNSMFKGESKQ